MNKKKSFSLGVGLGILLVLIMIFLSIINVPHFIAILTAILLSGIVSLIDIFVIGD